jgi:CubicO group peptidase (beta-lactamase class C family)
VQTIQNMQPAKVKLEAFIGKKMREEGIPGMTVSVTDRDRILWRHDFGYANADKKKPITGDTLFQIGSISKSFASVALLQLVQQGKVDLNKPAKRYLPWLVIRSKHQPVTLHHLLSHTAGILNGPERTTEANTDIWCLREYEASRPGEMFHYSNVGYKIVGEVLSRLEGKSIPMILQERVIGPLGMKSTLAEITHDLRNQSAVGYWPLCDDRPMKNPPEWVPCTWIESENADGSILSTSEDMCAYMRMLLNKGKGPRGRVLSEDGFDLLTNRVVRCDDSYGEEYYGYGLSVAPCRGHTMLGHTGGMLGFISSMRLDLDEGIGAFASTNCRMTVDDVTRMAVELFRRSRHGESLAVAQKYALPPRPRPDDYIGIYTGHGHTFEVRRVRGHLVLRLGNGKVPLCWREGDSFLADSPAMERHLLSFGRHKGKVVEAFHGSDWYVNARYEGKRSFRFLDEWKGCTSHYRSHNPWLTNFRVIGRKGGLVLVSPNGHEEPMAPLGENTFRVGADKRSPERIKFEAFIDGKAQIAVFSGCEYARCHTP